MPSRARRALLRSLGALSVGLAGCQSSSETTPSDTSTPTETSAPPPTETESPTPPPLQCGPGTRPDDAWPLARRGGAHDGYVADGTDFEDSPSTAWSVEPTAPPDVDTVGPGFGQPVVAGDWLYVVNKIHFGPEKDDPGGHTLQGRDATTGELQWSSELPTLPGAPAVRGEDVLAPSKNTLYAFDRRTGDERWTREFDAAISTVVATRERSYVSVWKDGLYALAPDGTTVWSRGLDRTGDVPPAVGHGRVYLGRYDGTVHAMDPADGSDAWTVEMPGSEDRRSIQAVVLTACAAFVVTRGGVHALDVDGQSVWQADGWFRPLATDGETLYGRARDSDTDGTFLRALDAATGTVSWEQSLDVAVDGHGVLTDGTLYVRTDADLLAVDPENGRKRWARTPPVRALALADGTLYGVDPGGPDPGPLVAMR